MKPIQCTSLLIEGFQIGQRAQQEAHDLGDISVTNKTKQTTFLHREIFHFQSSLGSIRPLRHYASFGLTLI
jgi:hypothetical protein